MNLNQLRTGDILLFRPGSRFGRMITWLTWSGYSHAGLVSNEDGVTYCLEIRELYGGRRIALDEYLRTEPTTVEVWRLKSPAFRAVPSFAAEKMKEYVGLEYGWLHVFAAFFFRLIRGYGGECEKHPPFCSEAVSRAYRYAGQDLRPDLADRFTLPEHLARSPFLERIGVLVL